MLLKLSINNWHNISIYTAWKDIHLFVIIYRDILNTLECLLIILYINKIKIQKYKYVVM